MLRSAVVGRVLAIVAISAALAAVALVLLRPGGPDYVVRARFADASQLVKGNLVQVAGVKVGSISNIRLTDDGRAEVAIKIDDAEYRPLRRGTHAMIFPNFDCDNAGGEHRTATPDSSEMPSCFVQDPPAWPPGNTLEYPHVDRADYSAK